jgi:hypothetical protein
MPIEASSWILPVNCSLEQSTSGDPIGEDNDAKGKELSEQSQDNQQPIQKGPLSIYMIFSAVAMVDSA